MRFVIMPNSYISLMRIDMYIDQHKSKQNRISVKLETLAILSKVLLLVASSAVVTILIFSFKLFLIKPFNLTLPTIDKWHFAIFIIGATMKLSPRCHCFSWAPGWIFITILTKVVFGAQGKAPLHLTPSNDNVPGEYIVLLKVRPRSDTPRGKLYL